MTKTEKKEIMVSTSDGYVPLSKIEKKGIWTSKSDCLVCGRQHLVTANSFNPVICFFCNSTRKKQSKK